MSLYAWKISSAGRPDLEQISSLGQLEAYLDASDLPGARPARPILAQALLMQQEGQAIHRHWVEGEQWTLLMIALH